MTQHSIQLLPTAYDICVSVIAVVIAYAICSAAVKLFRFILDKVKFAINSRRKVKRFFVIVSSPVEKLVASSGALKSVMYPPMAYVCEAIVPAIYTYDKGSLVPVQDIRNNVVLSNKADSFFTACKQITGELPDKVFCYYAGKSEEDAIILKNKFTDN